MNIKRTQELYECNPSNGMINEAWGNVDTTGWICIGEVPGYYPWEDNGDKAYIMVNPQKELKWGKMMNDVRYTEKPDGSGKQTDNVTSFYRSNIVIYPEYQDTEFGEMFLDKRKGNDEIKQKHQDFLSKLFVKNGNIILHHNSSYKLTDGLIKKGKPNGYSNNTDIGIYFWGSRNNGNDPSNQSTYVYYSIISPTDLYDFTTNAERLTLRQALQKYPYAGQLWKDGEAICVNTLKETPIWCVLDKQTGKWFNSEWQEIEKPF